MVCKADTISWSSVDDEWLKNQFDSRLATIMVETEHEEPVYVVISDEDGHSLTVMVIGGTKDGRQAVKDAWNEFYQNLEEDIDAKKVARKFMVKLQKEKM